MVFLGNWCRSKEGKRDAAHNFSEFPSIPPPEFPEGSAASTVAITRVYAPPSPQHNFYLSHPLRWPLDWKFAQQELTWISAMISSWSCLITESVASMSTGYGRGKLHQEEPARFCTRKAVFQLYSKNWNSNSQDKCRAIEGLPWSGSPTNMEADLLLVHNVFINLDWNMFSPRSGSWFSRYVTIRWRY